MARITEDARKCSLFLGLSAATKSDPAAINAAGTGFLVYAGEGTWQGVYLVTAAHVARDLGSEPFVIRLNETGGTGRLDEVDGTKWYFHQDDRAVDVAVMRYELPSWADNTTMPVTEFIDPPRIKGWKVGPGDAAYLVGLFQLHAGKKRNLPVVHTGNIALMPSDEKIPVKNDDGSINEVEAYLVEMHTLPGASGSPVMIRPTVRFMAKDLDDNQESLALAEARDFLLGVWIAGWPGQPNKTFAAAKGLSESARVPVGMGLVIPAARIVDILGRRDLIEERRAAMTAELRKRATTPERTVVDAAVRKKPPVDRT